ncbi:MAG TPA: SHOCT domain-containing protein [Anaerolineae bacterium]|nr:SHOCT domain-containing protein [Anaerolineae bacterium]
MMMGMGFGFVGMLLFWGALLVFLVGGTALVMRQTSGGQRQPTARQVVDERFARGEIRREEYDAIYARIE